MNPRMKKSSSIGGGWLVPLVVLVAIILWGFWPEKYETPPVKTTTPPPTTTTETTKPKTTTRTPPSIEQKTPSIADLKASVKFTGKQFIITNNDSYDWKNVKMEINAGLIRGGYVLTHPVMESGQTYTVGALQFAKGDGTRFNPFQMKPQKFAIYSRDARGLITGSWYGGWK